MRSRTLREGSVGLFILLGVGLFVAVALWLRGFNWGKRNYQFTVIFADAAKMEAGATVRYRGVQVGNITKIEPDINGVNVTIDVTNQDLKIPKNVTIEANQSGLIGETSIDITPQQNLPTNAQLPSPFDPNCKDSDLIICNQARVSGQIGVSFDELLRSSTRFANAYSDPNSEVYRNINAAAKNAATAAAGVTQLNRELVSLSRSVKQNLASFSTASNTVTRAAAQTANQFSTTASQYSVTAARLNQLVGSLNGLVVENRSTLVSTLNNFSAASKELRDNANSLRPLVTQANSTLNRFSSAQLVNNLETFSANAAQASANAAQASANLRDASVALNNPQNLLVLQRTLDSPPKPQLTPKPIETPQPTPSATTQPETPETPQPEKPINTAYEDGLRAGVAHGRKVGEEDGAASGGKGEPVPTTCDISTGGPNYNSGFKVGCEETYRAAFIASREKARQQNETQGQSEEQAKCVAAGKTWENGECSQSEPPIENQTQCEQGRIWENDQCIVPEPKQ